MSKTNPNYKQIIVWLNNLPKCKIFTKEDVHKAFENISENYINQIIIDLSKKEFYIGKNFIKNKRKRIDSFYKKQNIPTDKTLEDIKWFLRTGID